MGIKEDSLPPAENITFKKASKGREDSIEQELDI